MKSFDIKYLIAAFVSACLITTLTQANPPPVTVAQPVQVKVIDPVTVTGKVDIGNKVEISGRVETINDALKIPFHLTVKNTSSITHGSFYTVPVGMRLTIESVSAYIAAPIGQKAFATLYAEGGTQWSEDYLVLQPQGVFGDRDFFVSSQNLKIILDSTSPNISYSIFTNLTARDIGCSLTINGYLEEVP